jgi:hypothetical protein
MKMTSFENFSNVSRICQGILKTVEGMYLKKNILQGFLLKRLT